MQRAIALEQSGDILEYVSLGFDCYGEAAVPIETALETVLFYSGKPVGQPGGETYPNDSIFARVHCALQPKWGAGAYLSECELTNGGIIDSLNDDIAVLVRGDAVTGYAIFASFIGVIADKESATSSHMSIVMLKALSGATTDVRHCLRRTGQTYGMFGEAGRTNFGFNASRVRGSELRLFESMQDLATTGRIPERRP